MEYVELRPGTSQKLKEKDNMDFSPIIENDFVNNKLIIPILESLVGVYAPHILSFLNLLVVIGYFAGYSYRNNGQTLGKKWFKLKVVGIDGQDLNLSGFIRREFLVREITLKRKKAASC